MRAALCLCLLLAGCFSSAEPPPADVSLPVQPGPGAPPEPPPRHPVGRAWTYDGIQQYNPDMPVTVVVARADGEGYLFAGADEGDLVYEALWWNPLMGPRDGLGNTARFARPLLDWPLFDGKTWAYSETLNVTARATDIDVLGRREEGFVVEGENERVRVSWDYAPSLHQVTRRSSLLRDGAVLDDYRLVSVEEGRAWTWYELGELRAVGDAGEPAVLDVPSGYDALLVSAGGSAGGRARVQAMGATAWEAEFTGDETWAHGILAPAEGRWLAAVAGDPPDPLPGRGAWAYMHVAPVRWLNG